MAYDTPCIYTIRRKMGCVGLTEKLEAYSISTFRNTIIPHIQATGHGFTIILFALAFFAPIIRDALGGAIGLGLRVRRETR